MMSVLASVKAPMQRCRAHATPPYRTSVTAVATTRRRPQQAACSIPRRFALPLHTRRPRLAAASTDAAQACAPGTSSVDWRAVCDLAEARQAALRNDPSSPAADSAESTAAAQSLVQATLPCMEQLTNAQLARCTRALAVLVGDGDEEASSSCQPWLQECVRVSGARLQSFMPAELSMLAWSLCELEHLPGQQWLDAALAQSQAQLQDFYSPHLCDLVWGLSGLLRRADVQLPPAWLEAFMAESQYQLEEFPGDFAGMDLIKLVNGIARQGVDLQRQYPEWLDSFLKSAYLKSGSFVETAIINQGLSRLNAGKQVMHRDNRCTFEEVNWLPRHERDMRRIMKNYQRQQWGGWQSS